MKAKTEHPLQRYYATSVPHCGALGQIIEEVGRGRVRVRQPYAEFLLGDAERGLIHTSVQLSLVDSGFGAAILSALDAPESIATIDLRMDYQRPAVAGKDLILEAEVDRVARQIAFVSGRIWQDSPDQPTALARAAFMRTANNAPPVLGPKT